MYVYICVYIYICIYIYIYAGADMAVGFNEKHAPKCVVDIKSPCKYSIYMMPTRFPEFRIKIHTRMAMEATSVAPSWISDEEYKERSLRVTVVHAAARSASGLIHVARHICMKAMVDLMKSNHTSSNWRCFHTVWKMEGRSAEPKLTAAWARSWATPSWIRNSGIRSRWLRSQMRELNRGRDAEVAEKAAAAGQAREVLQASCHFLVRNLAWSHI